MEELSKYRTLGDILWDLRKKTGLSQAELASRVDTSDSYLSKLENNKVEPKEGPSSKLLKRLAQKLSELTRLPYEFLYSRFMELARKENQKFAEDMEKLTKEDPEKVKIVKEIIKRIRRETYSEWRELLNIETEAKKAYDKESKF